MIRTGDEYKASLQDGGEVYINGERVKDVTAYPMFKPLLAFSRDLLNSDYAGHRLIFQEFAHSPRFAHLAAVYHNFEWNGPAEMAREAAGISDQVLQNNTTSVTGQGAFLGTTADAVKA